MNRDSEYSPQQLLPLLQSLHRDGIVVWEDGNLFFKVITDLKREFPGPWVENPIEKEQDGVKYIIVVTGGYNDRYDCVWMVSNPETRKYFFGL